MKESMAPVMSLGHALARRALVVLAAAGLALPAVASAQSLERFDPNEAYRSGPDSSGIDADLMMPQPAAPAAPASDTAISQPEPTSESVGAWSDSDIAPAAPVAAPVAAAQPAATTTYGEDDLIGAAESVFGKGAEGLAKLIEDLLAKQGRPNGYIVGREAGGALIVGARYGSGTLHHKVEGTRKVYWTGPSVGFDAGANAGNTFVLVYNLHDSEDLFTRFLAGEGQAYFVGGLHASYLRKGDVVLIPIRVGAGLRLGVNAGYMRFSEKQRWVPF